MSPDGPTPGPPQKPPEYKVYRSRRGLLDRLRGDGGLNPFERLRRRKQKGPERDPFGLQPAKQPLTPARIAKRIVLGIVAFVAGWLLLSLILFFISAQLQDGVNDRTEEALSDSGSLPTGSTILVLGTDVRPENQTEPGFSGERADTIILMHVGVGSVRRLSVLRDTYVEDAAGYTGKINGAYAEGGGAARMVEVLEDYMGNDLEINHVIETDLPAFADFIDSLGGIDVNVKGRCRRDEFGGRKIRFKRGEQHLDGQQAVDYARIRCSFGRLPDADRVRRQQEVMSAIRDRLTSLSTFVRLPWVAWNAPKPLKTDLRGFGQALLAVDIATGGTGDPRVMRPDQPPEGTNLIISEGKRKREVERLLGED